MVKSSGLTVKIDAYTPSSLQKLLLVVDTKFVRTIKICWNYQLCHMSTWWRQYHSKWSILISLLSRYLTVVQFWTLLWKPISVRFQELASYMNHTIWSSVVHKNHKNILKCMLNISLRVFWWTALTCRFPLIFCPETGQRLKFRFCQIVVTGEGLPSKGSAESLLNEDLAI